MVNMVVSPVTIIAWPSFGSQQGCTHITSTVTLLIAEVDLLTCTRVSDVRMHALLSAAGAFSCSNLMHTLLLLDEGCCTFAIKRHK